ncbi:MAG: DUF3754 domain-containing protein, partial [Pseudomonadota bacterium]
MDAPSPKAGDRIASRFIPLTRQAVISDLCQDPGRKGDQDAFARLALLLQAHRNRHYRKLATEMRQCYLPFSPDRDTVRVLSFSPEEMKVMEGRLSRLVTGVLNKANYTRLTADDLNEILNGSTPYSLQIEVDLAEYDEIQVFGREVYYKTHTVRRPETGYLLKARYDVRFYRRLFVFLKLKSEEDRAKEIAEAQDIDEAKALKKVRRNRKQLPEATSAAYIYIKVFKDMPEHDMQILFPLRTVQFRPFDKIKFAATAGGGTLFGIFTTTGKVLAATNPFAAVGALVGFIGLIARQITTFFNQRNRYMMELAQKLFFHNLANNRAALTLLLDRAEEEDVKEELIALYILSGETVPVAQLPDHKRRIDAMIEERYDLVVDFELADA